MKNETTPSPAITHRTRRMCRLAQPSPRKKSSLALSAACLALMLFAPATQAAPFTPGNVVVYRVGSGTGSLVNSGNPVFLDEFSPTGALVQTIALPTANASLNRSLIASGVATSEGMLNRSLDKRYLTLTGYNATIPHSSALAGTTAASVFRTIGLVDWNADLNTATALQDFAYGNNPRCAITSDGTTFWACGGAGSVRFGTFGQTSTTQLATTPTNLRSVQVFDNQLYASSGSGSARLGTVGNGLPITSGQTITNLPGISTTNSSIPCGFFFADLSTSVAGNDTLYIADEVLGLQKFSLVGGTWTANGSIGTDADDYRGLTTTVSGTSVTLYATTKGGNDADGGGELVKLTDASGYNATLTGTPTVLATAANNTAFRGVALAPYNLPDLTVDLAAPATAHALNSFTYTLTARNIGTVAASDIDLFFVVPNGLTIGTISGASGFIGEADANVVFFTGGSLAAGAIATLTVNVSSATAGTFTTAAQAAEIDSIDLISEADETNNGATQIVSTVVTGTTAPEISIEQPSSTLLVSGASIDFGQSLVGSSTIPPKTFVIRNLGNAPLQNLAATLGGSHPGDFALNPSSLPSTIAAAADTSFTVTFTPTSTGPRTATLIIASNDADENPTTINLTGQGVTAPAITTQPTSQTIPSSTTATLTVVATGTAPLTYQWYQGPSGTITTPVGTNSASFTTPALTSATSYWVRVSNGVGAPVYSQTAMVTIAASVPDWAVAVSGPLSVSRGDEFEYVVTVTNLGTVPLTATDLLIVDDPDMFGPGAEEFELLSYQFDGEDEIVLTPPELGVVVGFFETAALQPGERDVLRLRMRVPPAASAPARLAAMVNMFSGFADANPANDFAQIQTVVSDDPNAPVINTHPTSVTINSGSSTTLSVAATGAEPLTYQWYQGAVGITTSPVGTNSESFTTPALTATTTYWVRVSNAAGNVNSALVTVTVEGSTPRDMALIPAGSFTMGRTSGDTESDAPPVSVTVSAFFMGKNEVTKAEWDEVRTWAAANDYTDLPTGDGKAYNHPVQSISWWDAIKYCNARSQKEGLTPCYTVSGAVMKTGTTAPTVNWSANGYRLPTEAEWEKAARGGVSGKRFPWGTDTISHGQANYYASNSDPYDLNGAINNFHPSYVNGVHPYTSPVGSFEANAYGLHDMAGNVWEWCWDLYGVFSYEEGASDPRGAATGTKRVYRGGAWPNNAVFCRTAFRAYDADPANPNSSIGFRVARSSATITINHSPSITTQPASTTIYRGDTTTLSVAATGTAPLTYQWYRGNSGDTTTLVGTGGASYTTPALTESASYWVRVSNSAGTVDSTTAVLTVNPPVVAPSITTQPASVTIDSGSTATLSVVASGTAPLTYEWYQGAVGTTTSPVGTNSASFTTAALTAATTYWVRVGNSAGNVNSALATVTVNPPVIAPSITTQPASVTIDSGSAATLSVVASGTAPLTYQWYLGAVGTTTNPVGTNSASFTTPALTFTTSYWVSVSNTSGIPANSQTATVTVLPPPAPEILIEEPQGTELASVATRDFGGVMVGDAGVEKTFVVRNTGNAPLSITASGLIPPGPTEFSITGDNLPASIAAGQSAMVRIVFNPAAGGLRSGLFRILSNDADEGVFTISFSGTGFTSPLFTSQPTASQTVIYNASVVLEALASGHPAPTYRWYRGLSGNISEPVAGATSPTLNTSALTASTSYWVRATNPHGTADSQTAFVEVEPISTNALLSNLVPSGGQLSPGFGSGTGFYTLLVPSSISELTLTPFKAHPAASIRINGVPVSSGNASQSIPIGFGENPINVIVTAQDGETIRSYLINATRSQPMFVSTENASGITRTAATLNGMVIPYGTATVRFEYGRSTNYEFSTPPQQVSGNNIADVQFPLVNLLPSTRYHFRMVASNGVDSVVGSNRFFDTLPGDPLVLTGNPVDVTTATAKLVGAVDGRGADVTIYFEYGTDFPLTQTEEQVIRAADGYKDVSANVSGLIANANYQVRLVARVGSNPPTNGSLRTFIATTSGSTGGTPSGPPIVTTGDVVSITTNSAEIRGSVNAQGGTTAVWIEYGTTSALGLKGQVVREIGNTQGATSISIPISGLVSGTDYHYRVVAQNSLGNVPGQIDTFRTNFLPPDVSTGSVSVLSTTSVRVFGTVRANRSDATVRFRYGTSPGNLDLLIDAAPAIVTGDVNRTISADLRNLLQGTRYYYQVEANNGGGEDVGSQRSFDVAILSGLDRRFPDFINPASHQGSLQVNLIPPATGGWRFAGEIGWRAPGSAAAGLAAGDRRIEYRSAAGYITPVTETLTIASVSELQAVNRAYVSTSTPGSGRLRVSIKPDSLAAVTNTPPLRAQWRLAGESDSAWRNTDTEAAGLVPGNHVIESKAIAGYETPAPINVLIGDGQTTLTSITYYISADPVGTVPAPVPFNTVAGDSSQPFGFVGQIFSDSGASTGFVVKPRVVATAGHVVFDDGTLSAATNLTWLFQREIGVHEPVPVPPRGFYLMSGYAAQRAIDNTPGVSTPASQNLDAAALYFADSAISRNGYSGYLASDLAENEFLISDRDKMLAGYPVEGVAQEAIGRMHATPAANVGFSQSYLRTYLTTGIRGSGGMSGGPLFVREASGLWYPAAIYLGGTRQMIVRAIDSDVADLFGFAEASAEVVEGSKGGTGVIGESSPLPTPDLGSIRVNIAPAAARNAGAGWRINTSDSYQQSATQIANLSPNTYTVRFSSVPGFLPPTPQTVTVTGGQLATLTFTYEELILPPVITSPTSVTRTRGQNLLYQITTQPASQTYSLFGALPPGVEFNAALGQITGVPQAAGAYLLQAGATNLGGSGSRTITLNVLPVLAAQSVSATKGVALNHPLVSGESGSGMSWSASQLPDGLVLDANSGVISGVSTVAGVFDVNVSLTRNGATASALATLTILGDAPAFTLEPPATRAIEFGTSTTFVVAASGEPAPTYQWYRGASGNIANPVVGATSPTFVTPVLTEPASFWVRATSIGRTVDSRAVVISLNPSGNAELASLETDAGLPSPSFNSAVFGYRLTLAHTTSTIRVLPAARVSQTSIQVNGQTVVSGTASTPISVSTGTSRITIQTTAGNGSTVRVYTLDVTRLPLPNAVTDPAGSVNDFSARLNGRVIPNGPGEAYFEYGLSSAYGSRTPRQTVTGDQPVAIFNDISGLDPLTTYHFRVVLESGGQVYFDGGRAFNTTRKPPTVATGSVFRSTTDEATLTGSVNPNGQNVTLFFEYGLSTQLGGKTADFLPTPNGGNTALDVSKMISSLQANNTYYYRLVAKDEAGVEWPGIIETFIAETSTGTADGIADSAPSVTTGAATDLTTTSATLAGVATPNDGSTEVWFEYGPAGQAFTDSTPIQLIGNGSQPRNATWPISGLVPEASYHFRMMARNSKGETPGSTVTFQTRFNPPLVTIGTVEAISPTSVRITGSVDPKGTSTAVDFCYGAPGTNFPLGAIATEGVQTGSGLRPVSVILINLEPSQVYETKIEATSDGGKVESETLTFQPGALLGLVQQFPQTTPTDQRSGQLIAYILPAGTGAWRFTGETLWRAAGEPATGLTTGNRVIEFRPEIGFHRPPAESVSIISGDSPVVIDALYYPAPEPGLAAITVNLEPSSISDASLPLASRAQWRFAGVAGDPWKNSGTTVSELPEGSYLIECKTVSGRQTPLPRAVALANDENRSVTFTYFAATSPILNPPAPVSYETAVADPTRSSGYVGQVRSDLGTFSGFAVKRRVVATAAQAVFDEATLSLTTNIEWLWLPDLNNHAPKPIAARGVYVFDGYAAQRSAEATPGTLSSISQNLNVAAIYFSEDAARGGSSGFLASDETDNPYLVSSLPKMLAGYPSVNVSASNLGRLHVLNPTTVSLTHVIGRTFDSAFIRGFGGMAGGPVSVRPDNGSFYPAGVYVGGTTRGIVRAIDTPIIDLFSRAEVSGNGGDNDTGGGITHTSLANLSSSKSEGAVRVIIRPATAVTLNAGWRLTSAQSLKDSEAQIGNLTPGTYSLLLSTIPGFPAPPPASIKVESGKTTQVIFDYSAINTEPLISEITNRSINEDTSTLPIAFTIGDMQSSADALTLSRTSSNSALVPNTSIVLSGTGTNRTVTITPAANQSGTATITIAVSDGTLSTSRSFLLTVNPVNDLPVLSAIGNQNLAVNQALGPLSFSVSDLETPNLGVSATSSNTSLVQNAAIQLTGTGSNRSLSLIPVAGQIGSTTITVSVNDGLATTNRNFIVTVSGTPIDTWRFANFGTAANAGIAGDSYDADGDNKSNIEEYTAGTDPRNPSDFFRVLSSTHLGSDFRVTVPGRANRNYVLQRTTSLTSPVWTPVASSGLLELSATLQLIDNSPPAGSAFYRVLVNTN